MTNHAYPCQPPLTTALKSRIIYLGLLFLVMLQAVCWRVSGGVWHLHFTCKHLYSPVQTVFSFLNGWLISYGLCILRLFVLSLKAIVA